MALIGYRRMSGAIGISDQEKGTRGMWWEKRMALVRWLRDRGHQVHWASRFTKASQLAQGGAISDGPWDVLMVEFGSSNASFYGKDLEETQKLVNGHKGPIVFLCDDPDLPYLWKTVPAARADQWACWYNAVAPVPFGGQPPTAKILDFPFSALQTPVPGNPDHQRSHLVYIGRPGGREKTLKALIAGRVQFRAYAKQAEWDALGVKAWSPPSQPARASFYGDQLGCLVLADAKHKKLGWRTGRAYHAILAGCPAVVEADHFCLTNAFPAFVSPKGLQSMIDGWRVEPENRALVLRRSLEWLAKDRKLAEQAAAAVGL